MGIRRNQIRDIAFDHVRSLPDAVKKSMAPMNPMLPDAVSGVPLRPCLRVMYRLQWEADQGVYVLLYPEGRVKLNAGAAEILARCDGVHELDQIIGEVERLFSSTELAPDIYRFLDHARLRGWLD